MKPNEMRLFCNGSISVQYRQRICAPNERCQRKMRMQCSGQVRKPCTCVSTLVVLLIFCGLTRARPPTAQPAHSLVGARRLTIESHLRRSSNEAPCSRRPHIERITRKLEIHRHRVVGKLHSTVQCVCRCRRRAVSGCGTWHSIGAVVVPSSQSDVLKAGRRSCFDDRENLFFGQSTDCRGSRTGLDSVDACRE